MTTKAPYILAVIATLALSPAHLWAQDEPAIADEPIIEIDQDSPQPPDEIVFEEPMIVDEPLDEIGTTVEDIEALISLPPQARLGREADEDLNSPFNVFQSEADIELLLGPQPRYVYFPEGVDPMILPWVRDQIVVQERTEDARRLFNTARNQNDRNGAQRAADILAELQDKFPEVAGANPDITRLKQDIDRYVSQLDPNAPPPPMPVAESEQLPRWVVSNTRGVMLDRDHPRDSYVLVGDFILQEGDAVDLFPAVTVKEILPQKVVFELNGIEHIVPVQAL